METNDQEIIKSISIQGQNNRYQIRKCMKERKESTKKKGATETIPFDKQWIILEDIYYELFPSYKKDTCNISLPFTEEERHRLSKEIENKRGNYKQQDILKKRWNETIFVNFPYIVDLLFKENLLCFFCKEQMMIHYEFAREMKQWTLDRIDNDLGHNEGNVVVSCLDCNLKKRRRGTNAFVFTKQLNIIKSSTQNI
jgi:hypothetical protein